MEDENKSVKGTNLEKKKKRSLKLTELMERVLRATTYSDSGSEAPKPASQEEIGDKLREITRIEGAANSKKTTDFKIQLSNIPEASTPIQYSEDDETGDDVVEIYYRPSITRLRIILMFLMCIDLFGLPTDFGPILQKICGFVPIAFFILSGYLVLGNEELRSARIKRAIKRSAIVFGVLAVIYFIINLFFYRSVGLNIFESFSMPNIWFGFLAMNVWPYDIGGTIWFVQALLYAYVIIFILDKLKLLRFDWIIALICIVFAVMTGELAGILKLNIFGYSAIPGNFLTRALPYILLGNFIHRKSKQLQYINRLWYAAGAVIGVVLIVLEMVLLAAYNLQGYYGHLIGMPVIAFSLCMFAIQNYSPFPGFEGFFGMSRWYINLVYYICQPVSVLIAFIMTMVGGDIFARYNTFIGMITFVVCFLLAWGISLFNKWILNKMQSAKQK